MKKDQRLFSVDYDTSTFTLWVVATTMAGAVTNAPKAMNSWCKKWGDDPTRYTKIKKVKDCGYIDLVVCS